MPTPIAMPGTTFTSTSIRTPALSATIALPLKLSAGLITWGYNGVHAAVGATTIVLGTLVLAETAAPAVALLGLA